jgi:hypothetical protein
MVTALLRTLGRSAALLALAWLLAGCGVLQPVVVVVTATTESSAPLAQALLGRWEVPVPPTATPMPQPPTPLPTVTSPGPTPTHPPIWFSGGVTAGPVPTMPNLNCIMYPGQLEFFSDGVYAGAPGMWPGGAYTVTAEGRLRLSQIGSGVGAYDVQVSGDELRIAATPACTMVYRRVR